MKSLFRIAAVCLCIMALAGGTARAQDLQQQFSQLGRQAAIGYLNPVLSGWGNDLNSGIFSSADLHEVLGFDLGLKFAMSRITDADKTYNLALPSIIVDPSSLGVTTYNGVAIPAGSKLTLISGVNYPASITANTAVGSKDNTVISTIGGSSAVITSPDTLLNGKTIKLPNQPQAIRTITGGFDIGALGVPLPMPQLNLGLPFGLEFMVRYVPTIPTGDFGKFNSMGFGLRYDIDQWIPFCPVDIAAHFMTQKMTFKSSDDKDILTGKATAYGLEVSKKLSILTVFAGYQLESSTMTISDYTYTGNDPSLQGTSISGFEVEGSNKSRFIVGARVLLLFLNVHADYSVATTSVFTVGAGISIR